MTTRRYKRYPNNYGAGSRYAEAKEEGRLAEYYADEQLAESTRPSEMAGIVARSRCSQCYGTGRTDNHVTGEVECSACEGTGGADHD